MDASPENSAKKSLSAGLIIPTCELNFAELAKA
jgi:hypothetical protein